MVGKIDSQEVDAVPLEAKADGRSGSQHSRRGPEARTDSMHSSSVTMEGMTPTPNRPQNLRRRGRSAVNTEAKESESSRESIGDIGAGNTAVSTARDSQPRRRQQQHIPPGDSTSANTLGAKKLSSKNPMVRYVVLTVVLILMGFAVRYLWRQLAGLAGAWLILAAARHWSGERQRDEQDSSVAPRRSLEYSRTNEKDESGGSSKPLAASRDQSATAATRVVEAGEDHEIRKKGELEWNGAFADAPSDLQRYWRDAGPNCRFVVRGMNYMSDKKKVPAGPAAMRLVHVDFFAVTSEVFHVASKGRCRNRIAAFVKSFEDSGKTPPFLFILNILIPGTPVVSSVMYWAFDDDREGESEANVAEEARSNDVFRRMLERYAEVPGSGYRKLERVKSSQQGETPESTCDVINSGTEGSKNSPEPAEGEGRSLEATSGGAAGEGDSEELDGAGRLPGEDFRNQRFKLIPNIVEGPFIVRRAVGNKPALLGRKLIQRYFRGPGYVETDVDVGSSVIAEKIVSLCRGYARSLTVELGVCLEGRSAEELPEKCIGVIRMMNLDMDGAEPLYDSEPKPPSPPYIGTPTMTDERDNSVGDYGAAEEPGGSDPGAAQTIELVTEGGPGHVGEVAARA